MPRIPIIAGNWKMNMLRSDALELARGIRERCDGIAGVEQIICPPYVFLHELKAIIEGSSIRLGAQNVYWEEKGAFTGEVSVTQIAEVAQYVIIGHSERRQYFGETDETVNKRVQAALAHGVKPLVCVGETLDQRNAGETDDVLVRQTRGALDGVTVPADLVVAYEPVWAIGTGLAADGATAEAAVALIRSTMRDMVGGVADSVRILYGGSVTPDNVGEYLGQPDIDGGLVGGASLKVDSFAAMVGATASLYARA